MTHATTPLSVRRQVWLLVPVLAALAVSAWQPYDRLTWWLEVAPVLVAVPILVLTHRRAPLTPLLACLIAAHALILIYGGAYTYARVPLGDWIRELLGTHRNPYDRIGHLAQGFVPALITREILRRRQVKAGPWLLAFLCLCVAMAISAWYELIEWLSALALGQGADEFLGSQGDPWDTQEDMACAFIGALTSLLTLSRWHDAQLRNLGCVAKTDGSP